MTRTTHLYIQKLTFSALYLAIAMVLPFFTGQIPEIGAMLCPMHIPALLCGFTCGWPWGLAVGFLSPLVRSLWLGMPGMYTAIAMAFEVGTYGAAAGLLYRALPRTQWRVYPALLISMVLGRLVWGCVQFLMAGLTGGTFTPELFLSGAVLSAVPGIILQIVLIPVLVIALDRAGIIPES